MLKDVRRRVIENKQDVIESVVGIAVFSITAQGAKDAADDITESIVDDLVEAFDGDSEMSGIRIGAKVGMKLMTAMALYGVGAASGLAMIGTGMQLYDTLSTDKVEHEEVEEAAEHAEETIEEAIEIKIEDEEGDTE